LRGVSLEDTKALLRQYVEDNSKSVPLLWDPNLSVGLLCDPGDRSHDNLVRLTHLLLLAASVSDIELVRRVENARSLIAYLHGCMAGRIYPSERGVEFTEYVRRSPQYEEYGVKRNQISSILASTNTYIRVKARGDLVQYSRRFGDPKDFAKDLSEGLVDTGVPPIEKAWMYLRWMTRPYPDLRIFNFDSSLLKLPLTTPIRIVGHRLGIVPEIDQIKLRDSSIRESAREKLTSYARELFPADPCKVDYPFYLLGRWLADKPGESIDEYLRFFNDLYAKTGTAPVRYDVVSRLASNFEVNVRAELRKQRVLFQYESMSFSLGDGLTYKPDFVLPGISVGGRRVILEPHGIWREGHEQEVTSKYARFRKLFGAYYWLVLLVQLNEFYRVRDTYPDSYDDIVEGRNIADLLYMLKSKSYETYLARRKS
jgi:hypothetical protein